MNLSLSTAWLFLRRNIGKQLNKLQYHSVLNTVLAMSAKWWDGHRRMEKSQKVMQLIALFLQGAP